MPKTKSVEEVINNIRRVFQVFNDYSKKAKRDAGLTGPQLWAIKMIAENAPLNVSELARLMFVQPGTVVGILDRLEKMGLTSRNRSQQDRRVVSIDLTEQGRELIARAPEVVQGHLVKGLEDLSGSDFQIIADGMEMLVRILGGEEIPPMMIHTRKICVPVRKKVKRGGSGA